MLSLPFLFFLQEVKGGFGELPDALRTPWVYTIEYLSFISFDCMRRWQQNKKTIVKIQY